MTLFGCFGAPTPAPSAPAATAVSNDHTEHHPEHQGGGMHHRFENAEQWAKVFDDPARDQWQQPDRVIATLELSPSMTVADVGAGTGYFTMRLAREVPRGQVIATDIEPDMIRYLTERAKRERVTNMRAIATAVDDPQLGVGTIDRILIVDVWHHLGDRAAYAKRLAAALRSGGRIVVVDFKLDATRGPPKHHRLRPEAIIADLRAGGLEAELSAVDLPEQYAVVARASRSQPSP
jgi:cyclopropane fatty-acyl-phospholipid synthase-like methyltransferase